VSAFCAICTGEAGPFARRPLGRGGAMVSVCRECDEDAPVARMGRRLDHDERVGMGQKEMSAKISAILERDAPAGEEIIRRGIQWYRTPTPGWIRFRVRRLDSMGRTRDQREAAATFVREPWAHLVHYIGCDHTNHVFERPDPKVAERDRVPSENPLAAIEQYRNKP
jgi:hypothetical protein